MDQLRSLLPATPGEPRPQFNAFGFCFDCGLEERDAERWEDRVRRGVIAVKNRHVRCDHVLVYCTLKRDWP